jgi:hypothetical protein
MADEVARNDEDVQTIEGESSSWIEITSAPNEEEGRLLAGFLQAQGIEAQVEAVNATEIPVTFGKLGEIRVYVQREQEADALRLLQEREREYAQMADGETVLTDEGPASLDESSIEEGPAS